MSVRSVLEERLQLFQGRIGKYDQRSASALLSKINVRNMPVKSASRRIRNLGTSYSIPANAQVHAVQCTSTAFFNG